MNRKMEIKNMVEKMKEGKEKEEGKDEQEKDGQETGLKEEN